MNVEISGDYGYVILVAIASIFLLYYLGINVGMARKKFKVMVSNLATRVCYWVKHVTNGAGFEGSGWVRCKNLPETKGVSSTVEYRQYSELILSQYLCVHYTHILSPWFYDYIV